MLKGSGDVFYIVLVVVCLVLGIMSAYSALALALMVASLLFGLVTWFSSRFFRWPVENIAIPLALKVSIGKTRFTAVLGLVVVLSCLALAIVVLYDYQATGVRRVGQGLAELKGRLGEHAEKVDAVAIEGLGTKRFERWSEWLWRYDMGPDDTGYWLNTAEARLPARMFALSDRVNALGARLEDRVFEGEKRFWFVCVYWFVVAVTIPFLLVAFLITVYQLSVRRLLGHYNWVRRCLIFLTTLSLLYCLIVACYLLPYVSHPYHTQGISFWVATLFYLLAGSVCCGIVRANHQALFSEEDGIAAFLERETR